MIYQRNNEAHTKGPNIPVGRCCVTAGPRIPVGRRREAKEASRRIGEEADPWDHPPCPRPPGLPNRGGRLPFRRAAEEDCHSAEQRRKTRVMWTSGRSLVSRIRERNSSGERHRSFQGVNEVEAGLAVILSRGPQSRRTHLGVEHVLHTRVFGSCEDEDPDPPHHRMGPLGLGLLRSEERRVGKECRSRWSPYH